jgi:hypothetical protein
LALRARAPSRAFWDVTCIHVCVAQRLDPGAWAACTSTPERAHAVGSRVHQSVQAGGQREDAACGRVHALGARCAVPPPRTLHRTRLTPPPPPMRTRAAGVRRLGCCRRRRGGRPPVLAAVVEAGARARRRSGDNATRGDNAKQPCHCTRQGGRHSNLKKKHTQHLVVAHAASCVKHVRLR